MSARSKDMIGACLISAGIQCAGEIHLAAGPSTTAFGAYWADWFENDRYHNSTNDISVGEDALVAGRNDVLLVAPGDHNISTGLTWDKDDTHLVGAAGFGGKPSPRLKLAGSGALTPMVDIASSGTVFAGLSLIHGRDSGAHAGCMTALRLSTAGSKFTMRNCFVCGPDDATLAASTAYRMIWIGHGGSLFENCLFGDGWPLTAFPDAGTTGNPMALVYFFNRSVGTIFKSCDFKLETTRTSRVVPFGVQYSPWGGTTIIFKDCNIIQQSSVSILQAWAPSAGAGGCFSNQKIVVMHDANTVYRGVTDIAAIADENCIFWPSAAKPTTGVTGAVEVGLAAPHDHT